MPDCIAAELVLAGIPLLDPLFPGVSGRAGKLRLSLLPRKWLAESDGAGGQGAKVRSALWRLQPGAEHTGRSLGAKSPGVPGRIPLRSAKATA